MEVAHISRRLAGLALILSFLDSASKQRFGPFSNSGGVIENAGPARPSLENTIADFCTMVQRSDFEPLPVQ
jgi:hypothetical protein